MMARETEFICSSQKQTKPHYHPSGCVKLHLPDLKLVILLIVLMSVPTSSALCSLSPDSCIEGRCRTVVMFNMRLNLCHCDMKCTDSEPQIMLCDRTHKIDFSSWCELRKRRCIDQIDYKVTRGRCAAVNDGGIYDLADSCVSHYCGYGGYARPDRNGRCFCSCQHNFTGERCATKILATKKRMLRKIMKRSVD